MIATATIQQEAFSGRKSGFEKCLRAEHERDCPKWNGRIVIEEPSRRACQRFLDEYRFTIEDLSELMKWYYRRKSQTAFDSVILSLYINGFIKGWKEEQREKAHE